MAAQSLKLQFPNEKGVLLAARLELPARPPRAYALFAHCFTCSKDIAAATRISRGLCAEGIAVLRFDFTGLGNSQGDFANTNFSSNVADLLSAAEHLRQRYEAPRLLIGHSLGGAAVLSAAPELESVLGVVTIGAPSDPGHLKHLFVPGAHELETRGETTVQLGGRSFSIQQQFIEDLDRQRLSDRIGNLGAALLILHAPDDDIVELDHARRIYAQAKHPKSFLTLDGADHLLASKRDSDYAAQIIAAWASRYLPPEEDEGHGKEGEVTVREEAGGLAQTIEAGRHLLRADEPTRVQGGGDTGPTPYDLLLASLGACTSMTLRMYANHKKWPLESVSVGLRHSKVHAQDCQDCESSSSKVDRIDRELSLAGPLSDEQRTRLMEIADRCPVHRTLENEKEIRTTLLPATEDD